MCQGKIDVPFMSNLIRPYEGKPTKEIKKYICRLNQTDILKNLLEFRRMNISRESLFPGLDGFAQAMSYEFEFYKILTRIGE